MEKNYVMEMGIGYMWEEFLGDVYREKLYDENGNR